MKFIFPQNYNFKTKILGIIDYSSAILDLIWGGFVFIITNLLIKSLSTKIFIFTILVFPVIIFSIVGVNGENLIYYFGYVIKYVLKPKILFYKKQ